MLVGPGKCSVASTFLRELVFLTASRCSASGEGAASPDGVDPLLPDHGSNHFAFPYPSGTIRQHEGKPGWLTHRPHNLVVGLFQQTMRDSDLSELGFLLFNGKMVDRAKVH
jgi:hypothetical protein